MSKVQKTVPNPAFGDFDRRERLSKLSVLVADRDYRTATLVQRILFSFGFRNLDITTSGESAMALLRSRPYDIIITELTMSPVDGLTLIKTIRAAKDDERIRRDIPILMLTARTDIKTVSTARDAGVTEFVAKPFSAKTISNRIIQIIDNPRAFVDSPVYVGPDRRRKGLPPEGTAERRSSKSKNMPVPSDNRLQKRIGASASEIMDASAVTTAQQELLEAEKDFLAWANDDIFTLERWFLELAANPEDTRVATTLLETAYTVQSQAGIFGYVLGSEVASMLVEYLRNRNVFSPDHLTVVNKHIEAIAVIFKQGMKDSTHIVAVEMRRSLILLTQKLG